MINDNFQLNGTLTIALNNEVVQETKNLVVNVGKEWVANRLKATSAVSGNTHTQKAEMSHMEIGTDVNPISTHPVAAANTALVTTKDRNALTKTGGTVTTTAIAYACTWLAGDGTGAITEAGIFNAATAGDMFARTKFPVVNKGADDSMTITWTVTVS